MVSQVSFAASNLYERWLQADPICDLPPLRKDTGPFVYILGITMKDLYQPRLGTASNRC